MAVTFLTDKDKSILDQQIAALSEEMAELSTVHIVTEASKEQKNLPLDAEKKITISGDGSMGNTAYIRTGENLVPTYGFNRQFPYRGVTITKKGSGYNITGRDVTESSIYFIGANGDYTIPVPSEIKGKTIRINTFCKDVNVSGVCTVTEFYTANNAQVKGLWVELNNRTQTYTVPDDIQYMRFRLYINPAEQLDYDFEYHISLEDELHIVSLTDNKAELTDIDAQAFAAFPYHCTVEYDVPLHDYIQSLNSEHSAVYATPEEFGAVGDGATDDSDAIAACLQNACETGRMVAMTAKYYVTSPVVINYSGLDVSINSIVYRGGDCAVKIIGQQNTIKIHTVISDGVGIGFCTEQRNTCNNQLNVNTIQAGSHGIVFYKGYAGIFQNTVSFSLIKAGGAGCYGIATLDVDVGNGYGYVTENTFHGGQISSCEWAVYKVIGNSKMYSIQVEGDVEGGFLIDGGINIFFPRAAETQRDGSKAFFKFLRTEYVNIYLSDFIYIDEIDVSEAVTVTNTGYDIGEPCVACIHGRVFPRADGKNVEFASVIASETYVFGQRLIFRPYMQYCKRVDVSTLDLRNFGNTPEEGEAIMYQTLMQLPSLLIVDNINTTVYLHPSYCAFGYDTLEIQQSNGYHAKVYDSSENLIFDGEQYEDGEYRLRVYKNADADGVLIYYPDTNQTWRVSSN